MNKRVRRTPQQQRTMLELQRAVTFTLLGLFAINVLCVLSVILFKGFGMMEKLSDTLILTLIAETVAQAGTVFITVTRFIFK